MAKIDVPIVAARYSDEDHDHAYVTFHGEHAERLISKNDHPSVWAEMHRSVVLKHFESNAAPSLPTGAPVDVLAPPVGAARMIPQDLAPPRIDAPAMTASPPRPALGAPPSTALAQRASTVVVPDQVSMNRIAALEARIAELESRPVGSHVDLDKIADQVAVALDAQLAEMQAKIEGEYEPRIAELERILVDFYHATKSNNVAA